MANPTIAEQLKQGESPKTPESLKLDVATLESLDDLANTRTQYNINQIVKLLHERNIVIHREPVADGAKYVVRDHSLSKRVDKDLEGKEKNASGIINKAFNKLYGEDASYTENGKVNIEKKLKAQKEVNEMFIIAFMASLREVTYKDASTAGQYAEVPRLPEHKRGVQTPDEFVENLKSIKNQDHATKELIENIARANIPQKLRGEGNLSEKEKKQVDAFKELAKTLESSVEVSEVTKAALNELSNNVERELPLGGGVQQSVEEGVKNMQNISPDARNIGDKAIDFINAPKDAQWFGSVGKLLGTALLVIGGAKWTFGKDQPWYKRLLGGIGMILGFGVGAPTELKGWLNGMKSDVIAAKEIMGEKEYNKFMEAMRPYGLQIEAASILVKKPITALMKKAEVNDVTRSVTFPKDYAKYQDLLTSEEVTILKNRFGKDGKQFGEMLENLYYQIGCKHNARVASVHPELRKGNAPYGAYLGHLYLSDRYNNEVNRAKLDGQGLGGFVADKSIGDVLLTDAFAERYEKGDPKAPQGSVNVNDVDKALGMIVPATPVAPKTPETTTTTTREEMKQMHDEMSNLTRAEKEMKGNLDAMVTKIDTAIAEKKSIGEINLLVKDFDALTKQASGARMRLNIVEYRTSIEKKVRVYTDTLVPTAPQQPQATPTPNTIPTAAPTATPNSQVNTLKFSESAYTVEEEKSILEKVQTLVGSRNNVEKELADLIERLGAYLKNFEIDKDKARAEVKELSTQMQTANASGMVNINMVKLKATIAQKMEKFRDTIPEFEQKLLYILSSK